MKKDIFPDLTSYFRKIKNIMNCSSIINSTKKIILKWIDAILNKNILHVHQWMGFFY